MSTKTSQYMPPANERELVLAWVRRTREAQFAHYEMAQMLSRYDLLFGVPAIIISAMVGVSAFSSVAAEVVPNVAKIAVGCLCVIVGVLSALQTFFKFSERSEKHKSAGIRYGCLRRKLEQLYIQAEEIDNKYLDNFRKEMDDLANESPHVPAYVLPKIQNNVHFVQSLTDDIGNRE